MIVGEGLSSLVWKRTMARFRGRNERRIMVGGGSSSLMSKGLMIDLKNSLECLY